MNNPGDFVIRLMNARTVAHILHLQTTSYAQHMALQSFYEGVVPLIDSFAEAYQGLHGLMPIKPTSFKIERDPMTLLDSLAADVAAARKSCTEPCLQNIIDEIHALIASTIYKIKHLK